MISPQNKDNVSSEFNFDEIEKYCNVFLCKQPKKGFKVDFGGTIIELDVVSN